jgi:capsular exopolysaccharide synthesis family protein
MRRRKHIPSLLSIFNKESSAGTEFRRLYSNLKNLPNVEKLQTIMVTSAMVGEGKSLTSALLAITIAGLTKLKVALVDFDLRRPKIASYFGIESNPGIGDVLSGSSTLKLVSQKTTVPNLTVIPSGEIKGMPSDYLDRETIGAIFQELRFYFDYVIVDSPPVIPISDPLLLAEHVDGVLLVVRGGSTQKEVVSRASNLLINSRINVLGVVLNDYEEVLPYYYKERYYGYHYQHKSLKSD